LDIRKTTQSCGRVEILKESLSALTLVPHGTTDVEVDAVPPPDDRLEALARIQFNELTDAETRLLRAVRLGRAAYCGPSDSVHDVENDPRSAAGWEKDRYIRAGLIRWLCVYKIARELVDPRGIHIFAANIAGPLDLFCVSVPFSLTFECCNLDSELNLRGADILNINLQGTCVQSIGADGVHVKTNVFLRKGFHAAGQVRMVGARIGGVLECEGSTIENPARFGVAGSGLALVADGIIVNGAVFLRNGFTSVGEVRFPGAKIGGYLDCTKACFRNPLLEQPGRFGMALNAEGLRVEGNVFLNVGFLAQGEVSLVGSEIDGNLDCSNATFSGSSTGIALAADRVIVKRSLLLGGDHFQANGEVRLLGSQIAVDLACDAGKFRAPRHENGINHSLSAHTATIQGNAFLRNGFQAEGEVAFAGAQIEGNLECTGGAFAGGLNLQTVHVKGVLFWGTTVDRDHLHVSLENAYLGAIADSSETWPPPGNLLLDGLLYERFAGGAPRNAESRLDWLARQRDFAPQPYRQLAKVLRNEGDDRGARRVLFEMEHRRRAKEDKSWSEHFLSWALRTTVGYGYYPGKSLNLLVGLIVLGCVFYWGGFCAGSIVPTDKDVYSSFKATGSVSGYYPRFHAFFYSADNVLPLVKLGQVERWQPDPNPETYVLNLARLGRPSRGLSIAGFLMLFRWTQIILGWYLATMGIAAVTGIVRKD
jgi:hypothetical protein